MIKFFNGRSIVAMNSDAKYSDEKNSNASLAGSTMPRAIHQALVGLVAMTCIVFCSANATYGQSFLEKLESVVRDKLNTPATDPKSDPSFEPNLNPSPKQPAAPATGKSADKTTAADEELPPPRRNPPSRNVPPKPIAPARNDKMPSILDRGQAVVPAPRGSQELQLSPPGKDSVNEPVEAVSDDASSVYLGLEVEELVGGGIGVRVSSVNDNSPAWKAGFKVGDLLQAIDGHAIADLDGMADRLRRVLPSRPTKFLVKRAARNMELTAVLQNGAVADRLGVTPDSVDGLAFLGVTASDLTPAFRSQFGLAVFSGAAVTNVARESPAYAAGVRPGDAIVEINGVPIDGADDLQRWIGGAQIGQPTELMVYRGTQPSMKSLVLSGVPGSGVVAERPRTTTRPPAVPNPQPRENSSLQTEVEELRSELAQTQQQLLQTQQRLEQVLQQIERNR